MSSVCRLACLPPLTGDLNGSMYLETIIAAQAGLLSSLRAFTRKNNPNAQRREFLFYFLGCLLSFTQSIKG